METPKIRKSNKKVSLILLVIMIFNIIINTMMKCWVRFSHSLYKDESYLTHTLPVTKNELYDSKFIQALIFFFNSLFFLIFFKLYNIVLVLPYINYLKQ